VGLRWNAGREGTPVLTVITPQEPTPAATTTGGSLIDEIVRDGARRMLAAALEAEVAAYIAGHADELNAEGRRLVVRNGHAQPRRVLTSSGVIEVHAPRVNDKRIDEVTGQRRRFASAILPAWCRKSPKITEVLALLYLHGLSSQDFVPALEGFLGTGAGLCAPTITRLTAQWQDEAATFGNRDLSTVDYVYVWADGIHVNIRLDEEKLCLLVMVGVRVDGAKELIALSEGYRESTGSWADLLRDGARRGMRAPILAVGDGALGFWSVLREVFPTTRTQRCWFHKIGNVLSALPNRRIRAPSELSPRSATLRTASMPAALSRHSNWPTAPSSAKRSPKSPTISTNSWRSTTSPPSTGYICAPQIRSSRPSRRFVTAPSSPGAPVPRPPASRWRSSSSRPRKPTGAQSTHHISSHSSAPAPGSNAASSSNDTHPIRSRRRPDNLPHPQVLTIARRRSSKP
jgi:hypothetical protein